MTTSATQPSRPVAPTATLADAAATRGIGRALDYLGLLPFAVFVALFLLWPTVLVVVGAFQDAEGAPTPPTSGRRRGPICRPS